MASRNERARWERWYDSVTKRMETQKDIITRLVALLTEARAALEEIAAYEYADNDDLYTARHRAQESLDRMNASAAAEAVGDVDSYEEATPVEDPRRNK